MIVGSEHGGKRRAGWLDSAFVEAGLWAGVCGCAIFMILSMFGSHVGEFDDVIPLLGGALANRNLVPAVDFYSMYPLRWLCWYPFFC
jgi:hypothetical protein